MTPKKKLDALVGQKNANKYVGLVKRLLKEGEKVLVKIKEVIHMQNCKWCKTKFNPDDQIKATQFGIFHDDGECLNKYVNEYLTYSATYKEFMK